MTAEKHLPPAPGEGLRAPAVVWMNRGHALLLRGDVVSLAAALDAYAEAIALLRPLASAGDPAVANSLGAALMNRAHLLHRLHGAGRGEESLQLFANAVAALEPAVRGGHRWARRNLAGTLVNRANLRLDLTATAGGAPAPAGFHPAIADARAALALVVPAERDDLADADLALKARRALCDALGQCLVLADAAAQDAFAAEASDAVDEALALIRSWNARGEAEFAPLAVRFFRFGVELYRRHQPQFLVEFIDENLGAAPQQEELREIARASCRAALADGAAPAMVTLGEPASERALETRRDIAAAHARL